MPNLRKLLVLSIACALAGRTVHAQTAAPVKDVLTFADGDRLTGELVRIQRGSAIFRTSKLGQSTVSLSAIQTLLCVRPYAVLRKGVPITQRNAAIGRLEVKDGNLIVTPTQGAPVVLKSSDVAYALDDATFEREIANKADIHEGWNSSISLGGSLVRSTENGGALNTALELTRALPGVDFLPRRNRTELRVTDKYEILHRPGDTPAATITTESHIFHASLEQNEYLHSRFFALANYTFDRNFAQGLEAQQLFGAGLGWTVPVGDSQELDLKTDFHGDTQGFNDAGENDTLFGQKLTVDYRRDLPGNLTLSEAVDYLPSYNLPHRYSADSTTTLRVPLFRRFSLSLTATDNYLNNASAGLKRNTLTFATSLTFTQQ